MADTMEQEHLQVSAGGESNPQAKPATLLAYYQCLKDNPHYRNLWTADFIDNIGAWLSYVATLELVSAFSNSSLALSAVVLIRFVPSLLLSPVAGVLADSCNRINTLVVAALVDAVLVACLALVQHASQTPLLFVLLAGQFTAIALQDPAHKAIVPVLVPAEQLHLAATLETFSWSLTGALGAAVGGYIASRLGNSVCFLLDALTYLIAAWCANRVPRTLGAPDALEMGHKKDRGSGTSGSGGSGAGAVRAMELSPAAAAVHSKKRADEGSGEGDLEAAPLLPIAAVSAHGLQPSGGLAKGVSAVHTDAARVHLGPRPSFEAQGGKLGAGAPPLVTHQKPPTTAASSGGSARAVAAARAACVGGLRSFVEGWDYLMHRENRDVAALVLMKGCGSVTWGAVDILNVKFSELKSMQVGDGATTLGLIFGAVGIGCFFGPVLLNALVQPRPSPLLWSCAASFWLLFLGSAMMTTAQSLGMVLASTFVRAIGSATLWIYSTLLLQLRIPNSILGRVSAAEMAWYTIAEAGSSVFGGAAFDLLHLELRTTVAVLTVAAGVVAVAWTLYAFVAARSGAAGAKAERL